MVWAHNGSKFDSIFLIKDVIENYEICDVIGTFSNIKKFSI